MKAEEPLTLEGQWTGRGEVEALQKSLKADLENVRASLVRCATSGTFSPEKTPGEWGAWQALKQRCEDYIAESPAWLSTVSQFERGEVLRKELAGWHDRARALGCDAGPPPALPPDKTPLFSLPGITTTGLLIIAILWLMKKQ